MQQQTQHFLQAIQGLVSSIPKAGVDKIQTTIPFTEVATSSSKQIIQSKIKVSNSTFPLKNSFNQKQGKSSEKVLILTHGAVNDSHSNGMDDDKRPPPYQFVFFVVYPAFCFLYLCCFFISHPDLFLFFPVWLCLLRLRLLFIGMSGVLKTKLSG